MKIEILFSGHKNVMSLHEKTIEITKDRNLTTNGDCIIGVDAAISCIDLPEKMKKNIQNPKSKISFSIEAEGKKFIIHGNGSEKLTLKHVKDIVLRKSAFTCSRTIAINCDKASSDIPRDFVKILQNPETRGKITIDVSS
ncbi:MAG: hypothetical protein CMO17_02220 [Thaumarchaeota archaeon]|nr:hypothetical protein [Nitrososphaerota archaeon]